MCGHRHRDRYRYVRDDRSARYDDSGLRASQQERDRVVDLLRTHAGEGRLELDELEQRIEAALAARTRGELNALLADLPGERPRPDRPRRAVRTVAMASAAAALLPLVGGIAILVLAPAAIAWVGWVVLGWWFFAGMPSAGAGFAFCGYARHRRQRRTVVV